MIGSPVGVVSVGTALPGPPVDNAELARRFGMDAVFEQWIDTFVGTRRRHLAVDLETGQVRFSLADMATRAGQRALTAAGLGPSDVDVMVMGTATPDTLMPATVNVVADRLRVDDVPTYQLQSGCCGAVQALDVGRRMLAGGEFRTALVMGAETCAKHFDLRVDLRGLPPATLVNVVLFGDGAGAAVLRTDPPAGSLLVHDVVNRLTGLDREPGQVLRWFGMADHDHGDQPVSEDYKAIEESVPVMAAEVFAEVLDRLGWKDTDVDYLLPPQLSGQMTARIVERLDVPDAQEISCVAETGNIGNALPFLQLERAQRQMSPGDRAVGVAIESSKWIRAAYAVERI